MQPSLLHTWEALQPNCNQIHTVTKIKKKTSRQKAILYSSPGPDQGLSLAWEAFSDPSPRLLLLLVPKPSSTPGAPFCLKLFRGIPRGMLEAGNLVPRTAPCPPPTELGPCLHMARQPTGAMWKASCSPPALACPGQWNSGQKRVLSHSPLFPTLTAPQEMTWHLPCLEF